MKKKLLGLLGIVVLLTGSAFAGLWDPSAIVFHVTNSPDRKAIGEAVDSFNGVDVYYNGPVGNVSGRNLAPCGYNLGQRYQCVEFVKRYYYEAFGHIMPDSYGHAKDFFNASIGDGSYNSARGLLQYTNGGMTEPEVHDLLIFGGTLFNRYGHVAIVTEVTEEWLELIQQNPGPDAPSRIKLFFTSQRDEDGGARQVDAPSLLGWLRLKQEPSEL